MIKCHVVVPMYGFFASHEAVNLCTTHDDSKTGVGAFSWNNDFVLFDKFLLFLINKLFDKLLFFLIAYFNLLKKA